MRIQFAQQIERADHLTRLIKIAQPVQQYLSVVGITRKAISHEIDVLFRRILEGEGERKWRNGPFDGVVIVEINVDFARDAKLVGVLFEVVNCDRIVIGVAQPAHGSPRCNADARSRNMEVVPFARSHQRSVGAELHGLPILILSLVQDTDTLHLAVSPDSNAPTSLAVSFETAKSAASRHASLIARL